jgi:hypothetical protein
MIRQDLFGTRPPARKHDPESSREAARHMIETGALGECQQRTIAAVRAFPGMTSQELAERTGLDRYMLARRLPEVEPMYVRRGETRACGVTGRKALTWWPA